MISKKTRQYREGLYIFAYCQLAAFVIIGFWCISLALFNHSDEFNLAYLLAGIWITLFGWMLNNFISADYIPDEKEN